MAVRFIRSPQQIRADTAAPAMTILTAPVQLRVLNQTQVFRGDVVAQSEVQITPASAIGASKLVVSAAPVRVGGEVTAGAVVVAVSGRPVIALQGGVPAYRDLKAGDTGADVVELQEALRKLGLPATNDATVDQATMSAVATLYRKAGYPSPVSIGRSGVVLPADEVAYVPTLPGTLAQGPAAVGAQVQAPLVQISSGSLSVKGSVDQDTAKLIRPGAAVQIASELLGEQVEGSVSVISPAAAGTPDAGGNSADAPAVVGSSMVVVVLPNTPLPTSWNGQNVRITATSARTASAVLVVPASAATTHPDGTTTLTAVTSGGSRLITVVPGLTADGYLEVTPIGSARLASGDQVQIGVK